MTVRDPERVDVDRVDAGVHRSGMLRVAPWDELRDLREGVPDADFTRRADAWRAMGRARRAKGRRPLWGLLLAGVGAAGAVAAWVIGVLPDAAPSSAPGVSVPSTSPPIPVVTSETLVTRIGVPRVFALGSALPFEIPLTTAPGRSAGLRLGDGADVRLDPGAEIMLSAAGSLADLSLASGRVEVRARAAAPPLRVRVEHTHTVLSAETADFGVLAAAGARWSAAVSSGDIRVLDGALLQDVHAGEMVGATPEGPLVVRALPRSLDLDVRTVRSGRDWIVRGLSDLQAEVTIDGVAVPLDGSGGFVLRREKRIASIEVTARDASGRRVARTVSGKTAKRHATDAKSASGDARALPPELPSSTAPAAPSEPERVEPTLDSGYLRPRRLKW